MLEFNCRLGDPETQVLLPLLESDLLEIILACTAGRLDQADVRWRSQACATVVMAAQGYPDDYASGHEITGIDQATAAGCMVFQAGTKYKTPA